MSRSKDPLNCKAARQRLKRRVRSSAATVIDSLCDTEFIYNFMPTETMVRSRVERWENLLDEIVRELAREMRK